MCRGGLWWAGRAGEPLLGARGYADATIMCERCRVANQQLWERRWPQQLRTDQAFRCPAVTQQSPFSAAIAKKASSPQGSRGTSQTPAKEARPTTELLAKVFKGRQSPPAALDALAIDFE